MWSQDPPGQPRADLLDDEVDAQRFGKADALIAHAWLAVGKYPALRHVVQYSVLSRLPNSIAGKYRSTSADGATAETAQTGLIVIVAHDLLGMHCPVQTPLGGIDNGGHS